MANEFTSFMNRGISKDFTNTYNNGSTAVRPASPKQIETYNQIMLRKRYVPKDVSRMNRDEIGKAIEQAIALPPKASEGQINTIRTMIEELMELGDEKMKMPSDKFFSQLLGGREDTDKRFASYWIQQLRERRTRFFDVMPPNDNQLDRLVEWYLCPEIDWENINIARKPEEDVPANRIVTQRAFLVNGSPAGWRSLTPMEFRIELKTKLTHQIASRLINEFSGVVYEWQRTRITQGQIAQVRRLEERLSSLHGAPRLAYNSDNDMFGEMSFEIIDESPKQEYAPRAYDGLDIATLAQVSVEDANQLINQLQYELQAKELYTYGENVETFEYTERAEYEHFLRIDRKTIVLSNWNHNLNRGFIDRNIPQNHTFEGIRQAQTFEQWRTKEYTAITNLLHALQAMGGMEVEGLKEECVQVLFNHRATEANKEDMMAYDDNVIKLKKHIRDTMLEMVDAEYLDMVQLARMCEDSTTAKEILIGKF